MRSTPKTIRLTVLAGGALSAGLALSACGSSSTSARATGTPTVTVTQAVSTSPSVSAPAVTSCTTGHLSMTLGQGDGAAGHVYLPLTVTNTGTTACTLNGYPGVSFVAGSDGHQVGNPAQRDATTAVATLTLQPGAHAGATIGVVQAANFDVATCVPTAVNGFRIYPPNETQSTFVAYAATGCSGTGPTVLTVTPLVVAG